MATQNQTVVGVFETEASAREAVRDLKKMGFTESEIGVVRSGSDGEMHTDGGEDGSSGTGAVAGAMTGAGIGALWGLGILAGFLPAIGPAIAGGTLGMLLSSAAAGAAAVGLAGALIGMGIPSDEAEYYESEMKAGRTIVTVRAGARRDEAVSALRRFGGYDMSSRHHASGTRPAATTHAATAMHATAAPQAHAATAHRAETAAQAAHCETGVGSKLQAREEKLHVEKTPVQTGDVTIRKEVHTEHKSIEVPVTREEVVIERRPVSGEQAASGTIEGKQEIRIPVKEEQVNVSKEAVVTEEVAVGKRRVQDTKHVDASLRKEEIKVEKHGDVDVKRS